MTTHFQPYALDGGVRNGRDAGGQYGVRIGGCGGRIVARDWGLSRDRAQDLCHLLEQAFELGTETGVEA